MLNFIAGLVLGAAIFWGVLGISKAIHKAARTETPSED